MKLIHLIFILFAGLIIFFQSCTDSKWKIDSSQIELEQEFNRFDLELFDYTKEEGAKDEFSRLSERFPKFYPLYVSSVMRFGPAGSPQTSKALGGFVNNKDIGELISDAAKKYPRGSLVKEQEELENGFKYFKHYFPTRVIPEVYTMISGFAYNVVCDDSLMGIGLDTYLGGDYKFYAQSGIPKYKFEHFERKYLVSDALKAWMLTDFNSPGGKNLLGEMIFQGKILYLLHAFLPEKEFHLLLNYDKEDLLWCEVNEAQIWFHFVDMELLYTIENHKIVKYIGDAPFVAGFPKGSPGRVAQWTGYKIVEAFMENNEVGLDELMKIEDENRILQQSKYKPRR